MQEFTINSNGKEAEPKPTKDTHPQNGQQKTPPQILNQNPNIDTNTTPNSKSGVNPLTVFLIFLTGVFATLAGVFIYLYMKDNTNNQESAGKTSQEENGEVKGETTIEQANVPQSMQNKIYYTDENNIYRAEKDGSKIIKLTEYTENDKLSQLQIINESYLGYIKCNQTCDIAKLDIQTRTPSSVKSFDNLNVPLQLAWQSETEYALAIKSVPTSKLQIFYINDETSTKLDEIPLPLEERTYFLEDSKRLSFSPQGDKFLHIYTSSKYGLNFNTNIYSTDGEKIATIENSTMPVWNDNNSIIYRHYSNQNSGFLYNFDIEKNQGLKINSSLTHSYHPSATGNNIVYWEASSMGNVYLNKFTQNEKLSENMAFPIWLNNSEVVVAQTRPCESYECKEQGSLHYETQFVIEKYYLLNIETGEKKPIDINTTYLENGFSTWLSKHSWPLSRY